MVRLLLLLLLLKAGIEAAMGMMAAAASHSRLLIAPSNLRLFLASPAFAAAAFRTRAGSGCLSRSRHLRWRPAGGVALPSPPGFVDSQPRRYVQCARSSVQAETAVHVENSEDVAAAAASGSLDSRAPPSFQQAIQRLQVEWPPSFVNCQIGRSGV